LQGEDEREEKKKDEGTGSIVTDEDLHEKSSFDSQDEGEQDYWWGQ